MADFSPEDFFRQFTGNPSASLHLLPQSGSDRRNYVGESIGQQYIITVNENSAENRAFIYLSEKFAQQNLPTPRIYRVSADEKMYIQSFVGGQTLAQVIQQEGNFPRVETLVKSTLEHLFRLQQSTEGMIDYTQTYEYRAYNQYPVMHDLYYFKFMFADVLQAEYQKLQLLEEFDRMVQLISQLQPKGLMLRDFQSRNIMVDDQDNISFIDYQSAMYGPLMYDVISFLYQAKANFPEEFRQKMLHFYASLFSAEIQQPLLQGVPILKMMRFLQVLGAYGFRGLIQHKKHFIESIPQGITNLFILSEQWEKMKDFPELKKIIQQLNSPEFRLKIEGYK